MEHKIIDGACTDSDGCRDLSRGDLACVFAEVSGRDNDGDDGDALAKALQARLCIT